MKNENSYLNNPNLKKVGTPIEFTQHEVSEYIKCVSDPIYFANNYIKIVNVDEGLIQLKLYNYQETLIKNFNENRSTIVKLSRQSGKCVNKSTKVLIRHKKSGRIKEVTVKELFEGDYYK